MDGLRDLVSIEDPKILSLRELRQIKEGKYAADMQRLLDQATAHVLGCVLCKAHGLTICNIMQVLEEYCANNITKVKTSIQTEALPSPITVCRCHRYRLGRCPQGKEGRRS